LKKQQKKKKKKKRARGLTRSPAVKKMKSNGFTLMEIIVSVFIMSIIVMIILPVFASIMEGKSIMEKGGIRQMREAQAFMNIMQNDLRSAFLSGQAGEDKFLMVNNRDFEGNALDEIYFTSFSNFITESKIKVSDQCEVGYYIKEKDEKKALYRKSSRIIDEDLIEGGEELKLIDSIEYFDVAAYEDGFPSEEDGGGMETPTVSGFPSGVLIRLGLISDDGRVNKYETAVDMPVYAHKSGGEDAALEEKEGTEEKGEGEGSESDEKDVPKD
jgi:prepilin-type N-terminal cleavage/methylation domain-containing protein